MNFPLFKTKIDGLKEKFDLTDPESRKKYFQTKAGGEIRKIQDYLSSGKTFIAYLLGKKNSGKGTYSKLFIEALGEIGQKYVEHISVGDIVRAVDEEIKDKKKKKELFDYLEKNYRGFHSLEELAFFQKSRSIKTLLPTEFILTLVRREISRRGRKALFLDGFPRNLDQVSYSLFFRNLVDFRPDPDFFVLIDVPLSVIDQRIKYRVICPKCQTPRNLKLLPTKKICFDSKKKDFYLVCDNPECQEERMVAKEGDDLGIKPIRKRLKEDDELLKQAFSLYGIPKVVLRNTVPVEEAENLVDDYEITPEYVYRFDQKKGEVEVIQKPWIVKDDLGVSSYSLMPAPVVISLIKQVADLI